MLRIEHFSKTYPGGKRAVEDLSLEVKPGEIYGFIGHNGAGKTTTIRAVAGVINFTEGRIWVADHDVQKEGVEAKRAMAFLPDNPDLYDFMTGIGYLNFIADVYNLSQQERTQRIQRYADGFELTQQLGSMIGSYSHGMKQKLALISAFIRQPKLLILDEPFVGLDPLASHKLKEYLKELCSQGGAVFFSTHVLEMAEKLCHRVGILKQGRLICQGTLEEITAGATLEELFLQQAQEVEQNA
ncbi:ABC transporter ATP-binding protein [uncultured Allofournierella sp.]|uniref:ABC transporter ATP-binding protein n=1 Tax=uncultured Allofournierella sp. TaxID=1940258 RepID=UPI00375351AF